jgi:hypothetical protein
VEFFYENKALNSFLRKNVTLPTFLFFMKKFRGNPWIYDFFKV